MRRHHNDWGGLQSGLERIIMAVIGAVLLAIAWEHIPTWGRIGSIAVIGFWALLGFRGVGKGGF